MHLFVGGREWWRVVTVAAIEGDGERDDNGDAVVEAWDSDGRA